VASVLICATSFACTANDRRSTRDIPGTLIDYAARAKERGSLEALVPYAADEEEGEMLVIRSVEEAIANYEWVVGEPIQEKTFTAAIITNQTEPTSIFTVYRLRITKRLGRSMHTRPANELEKRILEDMPVHNGEMLVLKSGGNVVVEGILLKKRGALCFSELLPRRYLLALQTDDSDRVGWLAMGCRSIYAVNGDLLSPREQGPEPVTVGIRTRFNNSLFAFQSGFRNLQSSH
jgi:hypothetical protein